MSKRDALLDAAKSLLWEIGYEAMSPAKILEASGAGQGSFYHHFAGKEALASEALEQVEAELAQAARDTLQGDGSPCARVERFLRCPRDAGLGCRLGRLVNEKAVQESSLRYPIQRYFRQLAAMLETTLQQARNEGELRADVAVPQVTRVLVAGIQGAYVVAKAEQNADALTQTQEALCAYLSSLRAW